MHISWFSFREISGYTIPLNHSMISILLATFSINIFDGDSIVKEQNFCTSPGRKYSNQGNRRGNVLSNRMVLVGYRI